MENGTETLPQNLQHRSPIMKMICAAMSQLPHGARNSTRVEVMQLVFEARLDQRKPPFGSFRPTSLGCYWRRVGSLQERDSSGNILHDESRYSVILNGLVRVSGKRGRRLTYELTPAGELFARS